MRNRATRPGACAAAGRFSKPLNRKIAMQKLHPLLMGLALVVVALAATPAHADDEAFGIDPKFRAKIAKERLKQSARDRQDASRADAPDRAADCGSQNIGNIDTGGRPGAAPREVFVFAPNAINIVGRGGCR
jgi:hypothetical protein